MLNMTGTVPGGSPNWLVPGYAGADGYQGDPDTGLIRCGSRYYNPYFGRFVTQDPAELGDNWYAYCGNEPIDQDDPSGLDDSTREPTYQDPNITHIIPNPDDPYWQMRSWWGPGALGLAALGSKFKLHLPKEGVARVGINIHLGFLWDVGYSFGPAISWGLSGIHIGVWNSAAWGAGPKGLGYAGATAGFGFVGGIGSGSVSSFSNYGKSVGLDTPLVGASYDWNSGYHGVSVTREYSLGGGVYYNNTATGSIFY